MVDVRGRLIHRFVNVDGVNIFYRETAVSPDHQSNPPVLLLHGFPSASHQYRALMERLAYQVYMVAPDYPGFGLSDMPSQNGGGELTYSFDYLAEVVERFVDVIGLKRFILYMFDFGAPVGFRLALSRPEAVLGLIVQNANAYAVGLSDAARAFIMMKADDPGAIEQLNGLTTFEGVRFQYLTGVARPELISPDSYHLDFHYLSRPGRLKPLIDLCFDYKTNLARYPAWQDWLRRNQPPTLVLWGRNDPFFLESGAFAYRDDVPSAEIHVYDTGHFALEECLPGMLRQVAEFCRREGESRNPMEGAKS